jgi:hypothetical protein
MDEMGLLLIPAVNKYTTISHTTQKGGHEFFTTLEMTFLWVNAEKPEEQIICPWVGQGLDSGEKGIGKALTYAEKYFLLKFFNIATDKDDPDAFQEKTTKTQNEKKEAPPAVDFKKAADELIKKLEETTSLPHKDAWKKKHGGEINALDPTNKQRVIDAGLQHTEKLKEQFKAKKAAETTATIEEAREIFAGEGHKLGD